MWHVSSLQTVNITLDVADFGWCIMCPAAGFYLFSLNAQGSPGCILPASIPPISWIVEGLQTGSSWKVQRQPLFSPAVTTSEESLITLKNLNDLQYLGHSQATDSVTHVMCWGHAETSKLMDEVIISLFCFTWGQSPVPNWWESRWQGKRRLPLFFSSPPPSIPYYFPSSQSFN